MLNLKLRSKIILDFIMLFVFIPLQLKQATGVNAHEILGVVFIVLAVYHCIINRTWIKNLLKVKKNARFVINIVLFIAFVITVISGVMISVMVFKFLDIEYNERWFRIHAWSSRIMIAAVAAHLINHWKMIKTAFRKKKVERQWNLNRLR